MTADQYLQNILAREAVDVSATSPVLKVQSVIYPIVTAWAGTTFRAMQPSGSFMKGTANRSGTDIDLFISLSSQTTETLKDIYAKLSKRMQEKGFNPKQQNVSINVKVSGYDVDLVPAKHQGGNNEDHSLYRRRADTWTKTNVATHINTVRAGGRIAESRILKLWRDQKRLDFPSFYLELATIAGLAGARGTVSQNVWVMFQYLRDTFPNARIVDPANTNNVISDDMSAGQRASIKAAAATALQAKDWSQILV